MNKETFLDELRGYLQILEDQEQDDILEEYAQHIDMKLQKGLGEEEAISDFGPVKELAAEILEAYHVKPQFQKGTPPRKLPGLGGGQKGRGKNFFKHAGRFLKTKLAAVGDGIGKCCRWAGEKCRAFWEWISGPFEKKRAEKAAALIPMSGDADREKRKKENTGRGRRNMRNFFTMVGRALTALWRMFLFFCIWWLRFFWNAAWLIFSIFCAAMAMIVLMGIGTMIIFLLKGYPVFGLLVMSIGGLLCFGSLSMGAFSLLIRKKKEEQKTDTQKDKIEQSGEEVHYEEMA